MHLHFEYTCPQIDEEYRRYLLGVGSIILIVLCSFIHMLVHVRDMVLTPVFTSPDGREDDYVSVGEALMAGLAAGVMESLVTSPFELFKVRAQVASASRTAHSPNTAEKSVGRPLISRLLPRCSLDMAAMSNSLGLLSTLTTKHASMLDAFKEYPWMMTGSGRPPAVGTVQMPSEIISLEGWTALWRGLRPAIVRDSIFGGIFFSSWQFLYESMRDWKAVRMNPIPRYHHLFVIHTHHKRAALFFQVFLP